MSHHPQIRGCGDVRVVIMSATRLETDVLMAESILVTVLGGFAARIDVAILPAASQESMAARQHRGFVVENAVGPDVGPGALDHRWACEGRLGNRGCKRGWGNALGYRVGLQDPRHDPRLSPWRCASVSNSRAAG